MKKSLFVFTLSALCMFGTTHSQAQAEVAVIVASTNAAMPSQDELSRIFLGKLKQFGDGVAADPIYASEGSATRDEFNEKVLNKNASQLKAYWSKLLFSGKGTPPKEYASDAEIINAVKGNASAIGYIDSASVTADVKVIGTF